MLIFGYIRKLESKMLIQNSYDIPIDIKNLCLLFYFIYLDEFDKHHPELQISSSSSKCGQCNDTVRSTIGGNWRCVYGKTIIDKTKNPNISIYKWTLKFSLNNFKMAPPAIGIVSSIGNKPIDRYCFMTTNDCDYDYYGWETAWSGLRDLHNLTQGKHYGQSPGKNALIIMELNVNEQTLKFYKDGEDLGIAFDKIDTETNKYQLAISIYTLDHKIQIMDFSMQ